MSSTARLRTPSPSRSTSAVPPPELVRIAIVRTCSTISDSRRGSSAVQHHGSSERSSLGPTKPWDGTFREGRGSFSLSEVSDEDTISELEAPSHWGDAGATKIRIENWTQASSPDYTLMVASLSNASLLVVKVGSGRNESTHRWLLSWPGTAVGASSSAPSASRVVGLCISTDLQCVLAVTAGMGVHLLVVSDLEEESKQHLKNDAADGDGGGIPPLNGPSLLSFARRPLLTRSSPIGGDLEEVTTEPVYLTSLPDKTPQQGVKWAGPWGGGGGDSRRKERSGSSSSRILSSAARVACVWWQLEGGGHTAIVASTPGLLRFVDLRSLAHWTVELSSATASVEAMYVTSVPALSVGATNTYSKVLLVQCAEGMAFTVLLERGIAVLESIELDESPVDTLAETSLTVEDSSKPAAGVSVPPIKYWRMSAETAKDSGVVKVVRGASGIHSKDGKDVPASVHFVPQHHGNFQSSSVVPTPPMLISVTKDGSGLVLYDVPGAGEGGSTAKEKGKKGGNSGGSHDDGVIMARLVGRITGEHAFPRPALLAVAISDGGADVMELTLLMGAAGGEETRGGTHMLLGRALLNVGAGEEGNSTEFVPTARYNLPEGEFLAGLALTGSSCFDGLRTNDAPRRLLSSYGGEGGDAFLVWTNTSVYLLAANTGEQRRVGIHNISEEKRPKNMKNIGSIQAKAGGATDTGRDALKKSKQLYDSGRVIQAMWVVAEALGLVNKRSTSNSPPPAYAKHIDRENKSEKDKLIVMSFRSVADQMTAENLANCLFAWLIKYSSPVKKKKIDVDVEASTAAAGEPRQRREKESEKGTRKSSNFTDPPVSLQDFLVSSAPYDAHEAVKVLLRDRRVALAIDVGLHKHILVSVLCEILAWREPLRLGRAEITSICAQEGAAAHVIRAGGGALFDALQPSFQLDIALSAGRYGISMRRLSALLPQISQSECVRVAVALCTWWSEHDSVHTIDNIDMYVEYVGEVGLSWADVVLEALLYASYAVSTCMRINTCAHTDAIVLEHNKWRQLTHVITSTSHTYTSSVPYTSSTHTYNTHTSRCLSPKDAATAVLAIMRAHGLHINSASMNKSTDSNVEVRAYMHTCVSMGLVAQQIVLDIMPLLAGYYDDCGLLTRAGDLGNWAVAAMVLNLNGKFPEAAAVRLTGIICLGERTGDAQRIQSIKRGTAEGPKSETTHPEDMLITHTSTDSVLTYASDTKEERIRLCADISEALLALVKDVVHPSSTAVLAGTSIVAEILCTVKYFDLPVQAIEDTLTSHLQHPHVVLGLVSVLFPSLYDAYIEDIYISGSKRIQVCTPYASQRTTASSVPFSRNFLLQLLKRGCEVIDSNADTCVKDTLTALEHHYTEKEKSMHLDAFSQTHISTQTHTYTDNKNIDIGSNMIVFSCGHMHTKRKLEDIEVPAAIGDLTTSSSLSRFLSITGSVLRMQYLDEQYAHEHMKEHIYIQCPRCMVKSLKNLASQASPD